MFVDLAEPGFNAHLEPQFRTMDREVENTVRNLRGKVICAIPPGLSHGHLLLHLVYTLEEGVLLHAPLHELTAEGITQAMQCPEEIDPWFLTSVAARRLIERLLGEHLISRVGEQELAYPGWQSLFYLQLVRDVASPSWSRHLHFGNCVAVEIDSFGGTIHHRSYPTHLNGVFEVAQKETQAQCLTRSTPLMSCCVKPTKILKNANTNSNRLTIPGGAVGHSSMVGFPTESARYKYALNLPICYDTSRDRNRLAKLYESIGKIAFCSAA